MSEAYSIRNLQPLPSTIATPLASTDSAQSIQAKQNVSVPTQTANNAHTQHLDAELTQLQTQYDTVSHVRDLAKASAALLQGLQTLWKQFGTQMLAVDRKQSFVRLENTQQINPLPSLTQQIENLLRLRVHHESVFSRETWGRKNTLLNTNGIVSCCGVHFQAHDLMSELYTPTGTQQFPNVAALFSKISFGDPDYNEAYIEYQNANPLDPIAYGADIPCIPIPLSMTLAVVQAKHKQAEQLQYGYLGLVQHLERKRAQLGMEADTLTSARSTLQNTQTTTVNTTTQALMHQTNLFQVQT